MVDPVTVRLVTEALTKLISLYELYDSYKEFKDNESIFKKKYDHLKEIGNVLTAVDDQGSLISDDIGNAYVRAVNAYQNAVRDFVSFMKRYLERNRLMRFYHRKDLLRELERVTENLDHVMNNLHIDSHKVLHDVRAIVNTIATNNIATLLTRVSADSDSEKESAVRHLQLLARQDYSKSAEIIHFGVIPVLAKLVRKGNTNLRRDAVELLTQLSEEAPQVLMSALVKLLRDEHTSQQKDAVAALAVLSSIGDSHVSIGEAGAVSTLVEFVKSEDDYKKENAATLLGQISRHADNRHEIFANGGVCPLLELALNGSKNAAIALGELSLYDPICRAMALAGGVSVFIQLAQDTRSDMRNNVARALTYLCRNHKAVVVDANGIPVLVEFVTSGSNYQKEAAAAAFADLTKSDEYHDAIMKTRVVPALLQLSKNCLNPSHPWLRNQRLYADLALARLACNANNHASMPNSVLERLETLLKGIGEQWDASSTKGLEMLINERLEWLEN